MKPAFFTILALLLTAAALPSADDVEAKPAPLGVNTDKDEDDPHVSSDGLRLYYTVATTNRFEIWMSERKKVGQPWPAGKPVEELTSKVADHRSAFVTPEGRYPQHLYYSSNRTPFKPSQKGGGMDIFFCIKQLPASEWSTHAAIVPIGTEEDEAFPWLMPDGLQLYFSRKEKDGWHLYLSRKPPDGGQFGKPDAVSVPVNFHHATLTPDGKTMYVQGPLEEKDGKIRWGLFVSTAKGKAWSKPEALTALNVTAGNTQSPNLSRDGKTLYFASDRAGGKGGLDLYSVELAPTKKK
jgi:Tol biopolymer transport system component